MAKENKPTTMRKILELGFSVEIKSTKKANGEWHLVLDAVGNRPRFESTADSIAEAIHKLHQQFSKWVKGVVNSIEAGENP